MYANLYELPRKRGLLEHGNKGLLRLLSLKAQFLYFAEHALESVLSEELDIEIELRNRLKETVESRLAWALLLQETLAEDTGQFKDGGTSTFAHLYTMV